MNLALSLSATGAQTGHLETCPDINGPACKNGPVPDEWHDLKLFFGELRLHAAYGIARWLSVDLLWSLRVVRVDFQLEDAATRAPIAPPYGADIHHRSETLVGVTDPWLSLRAAEVLGPWAFVFRAGVTFPVGATVPNPFALGREGLPHEHIQLGTGTVDPLVGVDVSRGLGRFILSSWLLAKMSLYDNSFHYRAGSQLMAGANVSSDLWLPRAWFRLGALVYREEAEHWDGVTETEGNLGRTDVLVDTALSFRVAGLWTLTLAAKLPLYSQAVGAQLNTPVIGELTVSRPFDIGRHKTGRAK